ncbi:hypothetical protein GUITHDRAFT_161438 [Guillardia theta CCMP2712]|uniref:Thioredoxin domain-containing protein n=1 Tax=Guillardia theta (strain CCMP2712) TaxID=905079 RepID=L1JTW6_GUITC|nr:hypothetical protein GUITHDRAFT_161438 [Guillardia theta CCMP2712]EKX51847.1 hypothetical protein GUITHDRAFT_161438 [Guillardia theta CCMP2712]|eukprot:XP_005838827.1 hypothetical protein GUITHDRAFT_161438 [Guillardia theta CCMP2712]
MAGLNMALAIAAIVGTNYVCSMVGLSNTVTIILQPADHFDRVLCLQTVPGRLGSTSVCVPISSIIAPFFAKKIVGSPAPPVKDLQIFQGSEVELGNGKVTVVEFWATWCPPCRKSIPHLNSIFDKYKSKDVQIIGISSESDKTIKAFCDKNKEVAPKYTIGLDTTGSVSRGYPVEGIPAAFVIDKKGIVAWQGHPMSDMEQAINDALKSES